MRTRYSLLKHVITYVLVSLCGGMLQAAENKVAPAKPTDDSEMERRIFVPFDDLHTVLQKSGIERVMMRPDEYTALREAAALSPPELPPVDGWFSDAAYTISVNGARANIRGTLTAHTLTDGVQTIPVPLDHVLLARATVDNRLAAIARRQNEPYRLFLTQKGTASVTLTGYAQLSLEKAHQILDIRVPTPAATRIDMEVPGDVTLTSGASVLSRTYDAGNDRTHFRLTPERRGTRLTLRLTYNNRMRQQDRMVLAESMSMALVEPTVHHLRTQFQFNVPQRPVDELSIRVPAGLKITRVTGDRLKQWQLNQDNGTATLKVALTGMVSGTFSLNVEGQGSVSDLDAWTYPLLLPQGVESHQSVLGFSVSDRIRVHDLRPAGLLPINSAPFRSLRPEQWWPSATVPDEQQFSQVRMYYASRAGATLKVGMHMPEKRLDMVANFLLSITDNALLLHSGLALTPENRTQYNLDFTLSDGWTITDVRRGDTSLEFSTAPSDTGQRVHVYTPDGLPAGEVTYLHITARNVPDDWHNDWDKRNISFPTMTITDVTTERGAIAVQVPDEMKILPTKTTHLAPLLQSEKVQFGLKSVSTDLAFRYLARPFTADFRIRRQAPRRSVETYTFHHLSPQGHAFYSELHYRIDRAAAEELIFRLPVSTPEHITVSGLGDTTVAGTRSRNTDDGREWHVTLASKTRGDARIGVSFHQPLDTESENEEGEETVLPLPRPTNASTHAGWIAVEGHPQLQIYITKHPRRVDIGELATAKYTPGENIIGAFAYTGSPPSMRVTATRPPLYPLPPVIGKVHEAKTLLSEHGQHVMQNRFTFTGNTHLLEVEIPTKAQLWGVTVDDEPAKPQRGSAPNRVLVDIPTGTRHKTHTLTVLYSRSGPPIGVLQTYELTPARLFVPPDTAGKKTRPVHFSTNHMDLHTPDHIALTNITSVDNPNAGIERPRPGIMNLPRLLHQLGGGFHPEQSLIGLIPFMMGHSILAMGLVFLIGTVLLIVVLILLAKKISGKTLVAAIAVFLLIGLFIGSFLLPSLSIAPRKARKLAKSDQQEQLRERQAGEITEQASAEPPPQISNDRLNVHHLQLEARRMEEKEAKSHATVGDGRTPIWEMKGVRSLPIAFAAMDDPTRFRYLRTDVAPRATLVYRPRAQAITLAAGAVVVLCGLLFLWGNGRRQTRLVLGTTGVTTLLAIIPGLNQWNMIWNGTFYGACLLGLVFLVAAGYRHRDRLLRKSTPRYTSIVSFIALGLLVSTPAASGEEKENGPVHTIPEDALIIPYNPDKEGRPAWGAQDVLVPYSLYKGLWEQAHRKTQQPPEPPSALYAISGTVLKGRLTNTEPVVFDAKFTVHGFRDQRLEVPLPMDNLYIANATVNGAPAKLFTREKNDSQTMHLRFTGEGPHTVRMTLHAGVKEQGGWRVLEAALPSLHSGAINLTIPAKNTELRTRFLETVTASPNTTVSGAVAPDGRIAVRWRPSVAETRLDKTLTVDSQVTYAVQEGYTSTVWHMKLDSRTNTRELFTFEIPETARVSDLTGDNIRGWRRLSRNGQRLVRVELLKPISGTTRITLHLRAPGIATDASAATLKIPVVSVRDANRQTGTVVVRHARTLIVRTDTTDGIGRTDLPEDTAAEALSTAPVTEATFQAYGFHSVPFTLKVRATRPEQTVHTVDHTIVRMTDRQQILDTTIRVKPEGAPVFETRIRLPDNFTLDHVASPEEFTWQAHLPAKDGMQEVMLRYENNRNSSFPIQIIAHRALNTNTNSHPLPRVTVVDATDATGQIAVLAPADLRVRMADLEGVSTVLPEQLHAWVNEKQRSYLQAALSKEKAAYGGQITMEAKSPRVTTNAVTSVRITDQVLEETVLIALTAENAGMRRVQFTLPAALSEADIQAPLLRQKTVTNIPDSERVRVTLTFQDGVRDQFTILVQYDRPLPEDTYTTPLPGELPGTAQHLYSIIVNDGRDEVTYTEQSGGERLGRSSPAWDKLGQLIEDSAGHVFRHALENPVGVQFRLTERPTVATAGASIGLSETTLLLDTNGAFFGKTAYHVFNRTEGFLELEVPEQALVLSALVGQQWIKPVKARDSDMNVRLPLQKTPAGELDMPVVVFYRGQQDMPDITGRVELPLLHTVNIEPEHSRVELRLPDTYRWNSFDGTLRKVDNMGTYQEQLVSYQIDLMSRLQNTLSSKDIYAKSRAKANIKKYNKQIKWQAKQQSVDRDDSSLNKKLSKRSELINQNAQLLSQVERQQQIRQPLRRHLLQLHRTSTRNLVFGHGELYGLAPNISPETIRNASVMTTQYLNRSWLSTLVPGSDIGDFRPPGEERSDQDKKTKPTYKKNFFKAQSGKIAPFQGDLPNNRESEENQQGGVGQQERARQYTKQLNRPQQPSADRASSVIREIVDSESTARQRSRDEHLAQRGEELRESDQPQYSSMAKNLQGYESTGRQSLAVTFPEFDSTTHTRYRFTSPRGRHELSARVTAGFLFHPLRWGGVLVLLLVVVWGLTRLPSKYTHFRPNVSSLLSPPLLLGLGVLGLLTGILPILAAALLILSLNRWRHEKRLKA